jgi:hypothetical protein
MFRREFKEKHIVEKAVLFLLRKQILTKYSLCQRCARSLEAQTQSETLSAYIIYKSKIWYTKLQI